MPIETHQERVKWLEEQEVECLSIHELRVLTSEGLVGGDYHRNIHASCTFCRGTGKVARYPGVNQVEGTLDLLRSMGFVGVSGYQHGAYPWQVALATWRTYPGIGGNPTYGVGQSLHEAAILVLFKVANGQAA